MQTNKILKGSIVQITGGINASGSIWWISPGKQPIRAAAITAGETVTLGPYIQDAQYGVTMETGGYFATDLGHENQQVPVPLANFVEGGAGVQGDGITNIVAITQIDYDELDPKDPNTLYVING